MNRQEKIALVCMLAGFIALVSGIAQISPAWAAIVGGVLLIVFGIGLDRNAV
ncbi:hypothetical protein [Paenalcaligenes suwonensis]|uniref:hypothetical protein n=1 Tax=Paenalcaligenes suwonensis TaxID=1202713 RepID=UPI00140725FB|nr:hypothetical protein [Paenalcaligenes suwonensis]NHC63096.1 hypothetical protein [Paenalcaligenes suwonensis]